MEVEDFYEDGYMNLSGEYLYFPAFPTTLNLKSSLLSSKSTSSGSSSTLGGLSNISLLSNNKSKSRVSGGFSNISLLSSKPTSSGSKSSGSKSSGKFGKTAKIAGLATLGVGAGILGIKLLKKKKNKKESQENTDKVEENVSNKVNINTDESITNRIKPYFENNTDGNKQDDDKKPNTLLYIGIGVGVLVLGGVLYFTLTKKQNKI
jgi:hypothetical protein